MFGNGILPAPRPGNLVLAKLHPDFRRSHNEQNQFPKKKFYHHDTRCRGYPLPLPTGQNGEGVSI